MRLIIYLSNFFILTGFLLFTLSGFAQIQFVQILPIPPAPQNIAEFYAVNEGSIVFFDIDGDGDQDVLITGQNTSNQQISKLYSNDGEGNFSEFFGTPFEGVNLSSIAFADIDGDGDYDVLITGENSVNEFISKLYINDGNGVFTEVVGIPFDGVRRGSAAFADIDGDGDQDLLITGENNLNERISKLYINDGGGNFSEVIGTPFDGVSNSSIAFADIDGDGDQDVLITGQNTLNNPISKLYTNDGSGNFSEEIGVPFDGVSISSIAFTDIDGDGDQDVLITGRNTSNERISKLYTNNGNGVFTEVLGTPFEGVAFGSIAFADIDGDGDQDVLITGSNPSAISVAKLYINDGNGNFSEVIGTSFDGVNLSSIFFADIDGDGDQDVLITGTIAANIRSSKLYINDSSGNFSKVNGGAIEEVWFSTIAFADVDGDGDQDVLISGLESSGQRVVKQYVNDGNGNFSEVIGTPFDGVINSSIAFADIDGDGDQDVLITGQNSLNERISKLYVNDGNGIFSEVLGTPFEGVRSSSISFADIDGDGDQDVLITGQNTLNDPISKLYTNDGSGNFSEVIGVPFDGVSISSIAFKDVDGDGDQDVLITGQNSLNERISKLYVNDGNGIFSEVLGTPFEGVRSSSISFADIDGDGDQDVLITGQNTLNDPISKLYTNDGSGNFSEVIGVPFDGVRSSSVAFTDVNVNGKQDVVISGLNASTIPITKLYSNDGNGIFTEVVGMPFVDVSNGYLAFADIDGDGDEDLLITGGSLAGLTAKLYRNASCIPSTGTDEVTTCGSYTWIDGISYFSNNNTAQFVLTNAVGCDSIVTLDLIIHQELNTTLNLATNELNDLVINAEQEGVQYQWLDCEANYAVIVSATNQVFVVNEMGSYAVFLTDGVCSDTSECMIIDNLGIDLISKPDISVYPNPSNGKFVLQSEHKGENYSVIDVQGKLVLSGVIDKTFFTIDLTKSQMGVYYLKVGYQVLKLVTQ